MSKTLLGIGDNVYHKIDQCHFMIHPRYSDVPHTSFLEARKLALSDSKADAAEGTNVDIEMILKEIAAETF